MRRGGRGLLIRSVHEFWMEGREGEEGEREKS